MRSIDDTWAFIDKEAEKLGIGGDARRKWRERGKVPHQWRLPIIEAARKVRFQFNKEAFDRAPQRESAA